MRDLPHVCWSAFPDADALEDILHADIDRNAVSKVPLERTNFVVESKKTRIQSSTVQSPFELMLPSVCLSEMENFSSPPLI